MLAEDTVTQTTTQTAECPECVGAIPLTANTMKGEILTCPDCGAELEVTSINPLVLDLAPKVEEDWGE